MQGNNIPSVSPHRGRTPTCPRCGIHLTAETQTFLFDIAWCPICGSVIDSSTERLLWYCGHRNATQYWQTSHGLNWFLTWAGTPRTISEAARERDFALDTNWIDDINERNAPFPPGYSHLIIADSCPRLLKYLELTRRLELRFAGLTNQVNNSPPSKR